MDSRRVAIIALLATLSGCAAVAGTDVSKDARPARLPKMTLDCIFVSSIDDWKALDDYNLIIYAPTRKTAYHIELETYCHALLSADRIGLAVHAEGRLCSLGGDALVIGDQRCTIGAIRRYKTGDTTDA